MIVGQIFSTKIEIFEGAEFLFVMSSPEISLEMQLKCVVSDFDVTSELRSENLQWSKLHFSLTTTQQF